MLSPSGGLVVSSSRIALIRSNFLIDRHLLPASIRDRRNARLFVTNDARRVDDCFFIGLTCMCIASAVGTPGSWFFYSHQSLSLSFFIQRSCELKKAICFIEYKYGRVKLYHAYIYWWSRCDRNTIITHSFLFVFSHWVI